MSFRYAATVVAGQELSLAHATVFRAGAVNRIVFAPAPDKLLNKGTLVFLLFILCRTCLGCTVPKLRPTFLD